jgi:hypothetical protein
MTFGSAGEDFVELGDGVHLFPTCSNHMFEAAPVGYLKPLRTAAGNHLWNGRRTPEANVHIRTGGCEQLRPRR